MKSGPSPHRTSVARSSLLEGLEGRRLFAYAYTLTDLSPDNGDVAKEGAAYGISNNGTVAMGYNGNAALYKNGVITDLGFAGYATDVNDSGVACGVDQQLGYDRPFRYADHHETILSTGGAHGKALAINAGGTIVGGLSLVGASRGFVAAPGQATVGIGTPTGYTESDDVVATGINDNGQIIGTVDGNRAFIKSSGAFHGLAALPGGSGTTYVEHGITNAGTVAAYGGSSQTTPGGDEKIFHTFTIGSNGYATPVDNGAPATITYGITADDINAGGTILASEGGSYPDDVYVYNGGYTKLGTQIDPSLGWTLFTGGGINDAGQIVGMGYNKQGQKSAYLLTPTATKTYDLSGTLFGDTDKDGKFGRDESAIADRTVFIDANGNGKLDAGERQTQSDANGKYGFGGLTNGTYKVSRVVPAGFYITNGTNGTPDVTVVIDGAAARNVYIGSAQRGPTPPPPAALASISGVLFGDTDKDGIYDANEPLAPGRTVFIDTNGNKQLDAGEKSTTSDGQGKYRFDGLAAGTYKVTRVFPSGYKLSNNSVGYLTITVSAGQAAAGVNLGSRAV